MRDMYQFVLGTALSEQEQKLLAASFSAVRFAQPLSVAALADACIGVQGPVSFCNSTARQQDSGGFSMHTLIRSDVDYQAAWSSVGLIKRLIAALPLFGCWLFFHILDLQARRTANSWKAVDQQLTSAGMFLAVYGNN